MTAPEERLAAAVALWLRGQGWATYHEVVVPAAGKRRADIVAVKGDEVWIVECKAALGWPVIGQALEWREWADFVSVATAPTDSHAAAKAHALRGLSLGWLQVVGDSVGIAVERRCTKALAARAMLLMDALRPEHQDSAAGNARSDYWTPTQEARRALALVVRGDPGIPLRRALAAIGVPSSASKTRRLWAYAVKRGLVDGVRAEGQALWTAEGGEF